MNWRLSALDRFLLVSNSDAHSPQHLAREANLLETTLSYPAVYRALRDSDSGGLVGTLEFYPEEGKYHYDGHRTCRVCWHPSQTRAFGGICPACGRRVTVGVLHRVEELADREEGSRPPAARPFESLIPLPEVIASALGVGASSRQVAQVYQTLLAELGPELEVLRRAPLERVEQLAGPLVAEALRRMRVGEVEIRPGYDGEYGKILLLPPQKRTEILGQVALFEAEAPADSPLEAEPPPAPPEPPARAVPSAREPSLAGLNPQQQLAATAEGGPIIVVAGPGTGKTRTLVHRIAYLVAERGIPPETIAAVTFTNRAANEIRHRVAEILAHDPASGALTVGTFHSLCWELLRRAFPAGLTLLDEADAREVLAEALPEGWRKTQAQVAELHRRISFYKNRGLLPGDPKIPPEIGAAYSAYQERLALYRALDYDDVLLQTVQRTESGELPGQPFAHLLVDEFQDVNPVQYRLVRLWAQDGNNLFVIGDPDQAIYGFRGADHRLFWKLKEDFPRARVFRLSLNYRSTTTILSAAQAVISQPPAERLVATRGEGPKIVYLEVPGEVAEGIAIVREIGRLVGGADMIRAHDRASEETRWGFSDIAVLFRTARQGEILEECFLKEGLPYRVIGRENFLEEKPVRRLLAFLRVVAYPEDPFHLFCCLKEGRYSLGRAALAALQTALARGEGLHLTIDNLFGQPKLSSEEAEKLSALAEDAARYRSLAASDPPAALVSRWAQENGLAEEKSLQRLERIASRFGDLRSFLRGLALAQEADAERPGGSSPGGEAVTLMTLHAAKGLEFPVVFIAGVEDGLIPLRETGSPGQRDEAEERRLFYVGLTRAKVAVYLVCARTRILYGRRENCRPSPYLDRIPAEYLERKVWMGSKKAATDSERYKQLRLF